MLELHAIFIGRVQGIGFRWSVQSVARELALHGTVCNQPDGSVEVFVEGERAQLEAFLEAMMRENDLAHIERVEKTLRPGRQRYATFEILHD